MLTIDRTSVEAIKSALREAELKCSDGIKVNPTIDDETLEKAACLALHSMFGSWTIINPEYVVQFRADGEPLIQASINTQ